MDSCESHIPTHADIWCMVRGPHEKCCATIELADGYTIEVEWSFTPPKVKVEPEIPPK